MKQSILLPFSWDLIFSNYYYFFYNSPSRSNWTQLLFFCPTDDLRMFYRKTVTLPKIHFHVIKQTFCVTVSSWLLISQTIQPKVTHSILIIFDYKLATSSNICRTCVRVYKASLNNNTTQYWPNVFVLLYNCCHIKFLNTICNNYWSESFYCIYSPTGGLRSWFATLFSFHPLWHIYSIKTPTNIITTKTMHVSTKSNIFIKKWCPARPPFNSSPWTTNHLGTTRFFISK